MSHITSLTFYAVMLMMTCVMIFCVMKPYQIHQLNIVCYP